jgi:hypothetical protein
VKGRHPGGIDDYGGVALRDPLRRRSNALSDAENNGALTINLTLKRSAIPRASRSIAKASAAGVDLAVRCWNICPVLSLVERPREDLVWASYWTR